MIRTHCQAKQPISWSVCWVLILIIAISTTNPISVYAANIDATIDRDVVGVDESFQLSFETDEEVANPDFSVLTQDFEILDQSRSQNISIVNGTTTRKHQWRLVLMPTKPGKFHIPAIRFGQDQSPPLSVTVKGVATTGSNNEQIFLEVEVDSKDPYVQQQIIYTVRLFRSVQVRSATLTEPEVNGPEVITERLGDDTEYQSNRGGRQFLVVERKYAIFPQQSGPLQIKPLVFQGQLITRGGTSSFSIFDRSITRPVRIRSKPIALDVRPVPEQVSGSWLPARDLRLKESWPQKELKVGEPVTRTISVNALGLTAAQLPDVQERYPESLKHYPEPPQLENKVRSDGIVGLRTDSAAIVPTKIGQVTLPELKVAWWNIDTDKPEIATVPTRIIDVSGVPITAVDSAPLASGALPEATPSAKEDVQAWWPWVSLAFACAWLVTMGFWWHERRRSSTTIPSPVLRPPDTKSALQNLRVACAANQVNATKDRLLEWGATLWPHSPPRNLGELASRCNGELQQHILSLEKTLYGTPSRDWEGKSLYKFVKEFEPPVRREGEIEGLVLAPLHRI